MTSVGKILVFFNLIFSVGVAALIAIVFSTKTNWKAEYEKMRSTALVLEAALKESDFRHKSELLSKDEELAALKANVTRLEKQVATSGEAEANAKANLVKSQNAIKLAQDNLDAAEKEVKRLQGERDLLAKEKIEREKMILELTKNVNEERQKRVDAENKSKSAAFNTEQLQERLKDTIRERENLRAQVNNIGTTGTPSVLTPAIPPPPKDVRGTVVDVSEKTGLTQISIGTNQGLTVGNKLVVFRLDPQNPKASLYLGELMITNVQPATAVGQFTPASPRNKLPKKGDEVAATLGK